jgi:hypothetical protein
MSMSTAQHTSAPRDSNEPEAAVPPGGTTVPPRDPGRILASRTKVFLIAFALSLIPMLLWVIATPISAVPDEPAHFVRAAQVVRGQLDPPAWKKIPQASQAIVPRYIAYTSRMSKCFAFQPQVSAGCQHELKTDLDAPTTTGTTATPNSPVFYAFVGLPSLFLSGKLALYAMRAVSAGLCAMMIGFAFMAISQLTRRTWAYFAAFTAVTPMLLFLGGSVNPNGVEVASALSLFATLALLFSRPSTRSLLIERLAIVLGSTILLTGTRSISLLWVALALGAALLLGDTLVIRPLIRRPLVWVGAGAAALVCLLELVWFRLPGRTTAPPPLGGANTPYYDAFIHMIQNTFEFGNGWIGYFGWLDTPAPSVTLIAWSIAAGALMIAAAAVGRGRARWAVILLFAALVLVPAFSQAAIVNQFGYIWQGRYTLAVFSMLVLAAGIVVDRWVATDSPVIRRIAVATICVLGFGQVAAFFTALERYVVGMSAPVGSMLTHPLWEPPLGWIPVLIAFTCVTALACVVVARSIASSAAAAVPSSIDATVPAG